MNPHTKKTVLPYTEAKTRHWLAFLARNMQKHRQTIFLIEGLQPSWLAARWQQRLYVLLSRLLWGLTIGIMCGSLYGVNNGLIVGLSSGLIGWFRDLLRFTHRRPEEIKIFYDYRSEFIKDSLIIGSVFGLIAGLIFELNTNLEELNFGIGLAFWPLVGAGYGLISGLTDSSRYLGRNPWVEQIGVRKYGKDVLILGLTFGIISGVRLGLANGLAGGLIGGIIGGPLWSIRSSQRRPEDEIRTVETLTWSLVNSYRGAITGLLLGILGGLLFNMILSLGYFSFSSYMVTWSLLSALIMGLLNGLRPEVRELKTRPNQGIWLSIRNGVLVGGTVVLIVELILRVIVQFGLGLEGVWLGLCIGLWRGGLDALQHGIVRLLLYCRGDAPLNYAHFLDYAAEELNFLQKVGGGYIFIHRYLLEHFAAMAVEGERHTNTTANYGSNGFVLEQ